MKVHYLVDFFNSTVAFDTVTSRIENAKERHSGVRVQKTNAVHDDLLLPDPRT